MVTHERKRFPDKVTYLSSPGYLDGGDARKRFWLIAGGPSAIITMLGILRPDPVTKEFSLDGWFAFSSVEEIRANTGWDLRIWSGASVVIEPAVEELAHLRRVDQTGAIRKVAS